ncbi:hypothetical protein PIB30_098793, partial [Stylosanthes scabra]|nr:hypothetical protein [Stylosanthes scabra]
MALSPKFIKSLRKQVMELYYSCNQGYTPWNPTPYQPHDLGYNTYQSNGFGDAYYGYEDPPPPHPPSQGNFEDIFQVLLQERKEFWETQSTSITSQPLNSGDLPSQALSIPRRSIPTIFLCANQEGREDAPLNEGDIENLNHEEVRECLIEVEEKNEDQEVEDVDHEVNFSNLNFIGPQHYGLLETDGQLKALCGVLDKNKEDSAELGSEFKTYSGYLHKLHNNRTK